MLPLFDRARAALRGHVQTRMVRSVIGVFVLFSLIFGSFLPAPVVMAAALQYAANVESVTYPKTLKPGESGEVVVTFKNIGTVTWPASGKNYTSLYRWDPEKKVEVTSVLSTAGWSGDQQPVKFASAVKPGALATVRFPIRAPEVAGQIKESYVVTMENLARMKYSSFDVVLNVTPAANSPVVSTPVTTAPAPVVSTPVVTTPTLTTKDGWSAKFITMGGSEWQINPEENTFATLVFQNTGTQTWKKDGANYVSVYAIDDANKERTSTFKDQSWLSGSQAAKLVENEVRPGQQGTFKIELRAPFQPGMYQEKFQLAAENLSWIAGGSATLPIRVPFTSAFVATSAPLENPRDIIPVADAAKSNYTATMLLRSTQQITVSGNASQQVTFGFKNTGATAWGSHSVRVSGLQPALTGKAYSIRDDSWPSTAETVEVRTPTKPGEIAFATFKIKAPAKKGVYTAMFKLHADGSPVDGGEIQIPITVTADGYYEPDPVKPVSSTPSNTSSNTTAPTATNSSVPSVNPVPLNGDTSSLPNEPLIRVGLFKAANDQMTVLAKYVPLIVKNNGSDVCTVALGQSVSIAYNRGSKQYQLTGACSGTSSNYYVVRANDGISAMQITSYSFTYSWLPEANDNKFRAQVELRFAPKTGNTWAIQEVPIEAYLKGIAETSNSSPQEFQRTLLTTARTYAMYHVQRQTKHADEFFYVDAELDQVYRGYGSEVRTPNIGAAVDATRGQIVTYAGKLAITPYFSRSDGRTRSWNEVWGGTSPEWLVTVPVPWDQGKTLWGHGVGMSASGALSMSVEGWTYDRILKYYFKGIELRKAYK